MKRILIAVMICVCLLVFGAIIVFNAVTGTGRTIASIAPAKTPPPAGFVAEDYPDIAALSDVDGLSVTRLADAGEYFEHYYLTDQQVAHFTFLTESGDTRVFVGADGTIIGRLAGSALIYPMANYFVDMDGYAEVTAKTVSEIRPYTIIEGQPTPDEMRRYHDESTLYRQFTPYEYGSERPEAAGKLTVHVMLHDGVWKRAVTVSDAMLEWKTTPFVTLERQSLLDLPETEGLSGGKYRLRRVYFDQQTYFGGRGPVIGSTTGSSVPAYWEGTGYYELQAGDSVLKFAVTDDVLNLSGWGYIGLSTLGGEGLDYVILERAAHYGKDDGVIYLVTAK